jgi:hypothetical protein
MIQRLGSPQQALATHQEEANAQHYEVPTSFLQGDEERQSNQTFVDLAETLTA